MEKYRTIFKGQPKLVTQGKTVQMPLFPPKTPH